MAVIFVFIFLLHLPLLGLPYFWDEAGYYVPAARDILVTGSLIPRSTVSNAHPPLVLLWVALWWKVVGYAPAVARSAMLLLGAFALLGVFRLTERLANRGVAVAATLCTALYPVFFAQSSLVQVDLAAAGFIFWALDAYFDESALASFIWFALAGLAKETAILAPIALAGWQIVGFVARRTSLHGLWRNSNDGVQPAVDQARRILGLLLSAMPLALWYGFHYGRTGHVFGNPEFFRYNVTSTLNLTRFFLALWLRAWQVCGYLCLWILTLAALFAMGVLVPKCDSGVARPRTSASAQMVFYVVIATYLIAMALLGGAVLARYMLPAVPLVIILCTSTLWRRLRYWRTATGLISLGFVLAWFWNPPYEFSPEDNLAYRDYVQLHEKGEQFLEARYPMARVLTAWPASDEITRPWLGYTTRPMRVERIENFSLEQVLKAAVLDAHYDVALVFSTKYEPGPTLWDRWPGFSGLRMRWKRQFFGYHRDLPPEAIAHVLGGRVVFLEHRRGQWIAVIALERAEEAKRKNQELTLAAGE